MREKVIGKVCLSEATAQNPYYDECGTLIIIGFRVSRSVCLRLPIRTLIMMSVGPLLL